MIERIQIVLKRGFIFLHSKLKTLPNQFRLPIPRLDGLEMHLYIAKSKEPDHSTEIDPGSESCLTTSNGKKLLSPQPFKHFKKKLKKNQKRLSKFKSNSSNRNKSRIEVAKIHSKNIRHDFYHILSTQLIYENQAIIIKGLDIKSMLKNKRYAKGISDAGWRQLLPCLKYTCDWYGRNIVELPQNFPGTQRCSMCRHNIGKLDCDIRSWKCPKCNTLHDRDFNAAYNIDTEGQSVI